MAFTATATSKYLDFAPAYRNCRSFRKLVKVFDALAAEVAVPPLARWVACRVGFVADSDRQP
jgi:hypothetical protein